MVFLRSLAGRDTNPITGIYAPNDVRRVPGLSLTTRCRFHTAPDKAVKITDGARFPCSRQTRPVPGLPAVLVVL